MWVRGLKLGVSLLLAKRKSVAPHVGAWIETSARQGCSRFPRSHPMWVRGLKLVNLAAQRLANVAPHVGAWIETMTVFAFDRESESHPMWVRGLKLAKLDEWCVKYSRTPCGCVD